MGYFFDSFSGLETVLFVIAASSTLILVIQTILSFSGVDGGEDMDSGTDFSGDELIESAGAEPSSDKSNFDAAGFKLVTVRGILAFMMMGGWVGFIALRAEINWFVALLFALAAGAASLYGIAKLMQALMGLHNDGTLRVSNALGQTGTVYIRIPGAEQGMGKVSVTVQERLCEFDAITEDSEGLKTGERIYVTDIREGNVLVVERFDK